MSRKRAAWEGAEEGKGPLSWEGPQTGHCPSNHHSRQEAGRSLFGHTGSPSEGTWRCSHSAEGGTWSPVLLTGFRWGAEVYPNLRHVRCLSLVKDECSV